MVTEYNDHLLSSCTLAIPCTSSGMIRVASIIHWNLLKHYNQSVSPNYWDHITAPVVERPDVKVLWDLNIFIDHHLVAWHPDIVDIENSKRWLRLLVRQYLQTEMLL